MRENSGEGDAQNNLRDPTLKEHEAEGGRHPPIPTPADEVEIGSNARERGEDPWPDNRERGETSRAGKAPPADPHP